MRLPVPRPGRAKRPLAGVGLLFRLYDLGNAASMIGLGMAFVVVGITFLFFLPWVGIPLGIVGFVLVILWLAGLVRAREVVRKEPERPPHSR